MKPNPKPTSKRPQLENSVVICGDDWAGIRHKEPFVEVLVHVKGGSLPKSDKPRAIALLTTTHGESRRFLQTLRTALRKNIGTGLPADTLVEGEGDSFTVTVFNDDTHHKVMEVMNKTPKKRPLQTLVKAIADKVRVEGEFTELPPIPTTPSNNRVAGL